MCPADKNRRRFKVVALSAHLFFPFELCIDRLEYSYKYSK